MLRTHGKIICFIQMFSTRLGTIGWGLLCVLPLVLPSTTLVKTGDGRMVLAAANLFQGETIISNGTLLVQSPGSIGASGFPVTVHAGGHFGGTGIINRNTRVQTGGFLELGNDSATIGMLTFNGNLMLAGTTSIKLNKSYAPSNNLVNVSGTLTFGGTLAVTNLGSALAAGDSFRLFSGAGMASFTNLILSALPNGLGWTNQLPLNGSIAVVTTVNLTPTNLAATFSNGNLTLSWPADHTGWHLQAQTNVLGTNWWSFIGSETTNSWVVPINLTNQSVYFRLIYP